MQHMIPDEEFEERMGRRIKAFSCITDEGTRTRMTPVTLGEGNNVWFMPCTSCMGQLESQILKPLFIRAVKESKE